ncbi:MAG TPA: malto-oligosyltrehalose synthase [Roseiarcus sp.]
MTADRDPVKGKGGAKPIPRATYRLQFNRDFGFDQAAGLAPYLADLGVSHVYCSPYLRARPGSAHGYDIISHTELNPDLGDSASFNRMVAAFERQGLRQILDFVPNHMGVCGADNPRWLDVLEWGPHSAFAGWFDIDWEPDRRYLAGKLLVPVLGEQYGAALSSGALKLKFEAEAGAFAVWAYDNHKLPICPLSYDLVLGDGHPTLEVLGDAFSHLDVRDRLIANRGKDLQEKLAEAVAADPNVAAAIARGLDRFTVVPDDPRSWRELDALIRVQHWRVAHFRVASDDINYARFFDVNELARIRMEVPELFDYAHSLIFSLLEAGVLDGLRIDHIDGLHDPKQYCLRLRGRAPRPFYLVVEKILASHEELRDDWEIDGATGYEVASSITGLLIDPAGEERLTRLYSEFTGRRDSFEDVVRACKLRIMENELASELNSLARDVAGVARSNPRTADFTQNLLHRALKEIIAVFPVYRTYIDESAAPTIADRREIDWAVGKARRHATAIDGSVFDFLHALLTCDIISKPKSGFSRTSVIRVAMRLQRYTGPVMAKGTEDTAFFRYARLLALNEVGGHPSEFHVTASAFHRANRKRAQRFPHAMLSTSTHDTKRGEDTRARLAVLSEAAEEWAQNVVVWNRVLRAGGAGSGHEGPPDRNDEYAFYQFLLGAWPPELSAENPDPERLAVFRGRLEAAMTKAMREAKTHTTWGAPNMAYEDAVIGFIRAALDISRKNTFLESFGTFLNKIATAGMRNSLIQTVLKLTLPGVPDFYQGAELWDFNFVDPDNRRPVDYEQRKRLLREIRRREPSVELLDDLILNWRDGRIKLMLTSQLLKLRELKPGLFRDGSYDELGASNGASDRICAFARSVGQDAIIAAVLLYPGHDSGEDLADAMIELPPELRDKTWVDLFSGRAAALRDGMLVARNLFSILPVSVLVPAG